MPRVLVRCSFFGFQHHDHSSVSKRFCGVVPEDTFHRRVRYVVGRELVAEGSTLPWGTDEARKRVLTRWFG